MIVVDSATEPLRVFTGEQFTHDIDVLPVTTTVLIGSLFGSTTSDFDEPQYVGQPLVLPVDPGSVERWALTDTAATTWVLPALPDNTVPLPVALNGEPVEYWETPLETSLVLVFGVVNLLTESLDGDELRRRFDELADRWSRETEFISLHTRAIQHPSYQEIIDIGQAAVPWLLERLRDRPDHWLWALATLTGEDPAAGAVGFWEARDDWLNWGRERDYIA